MRPTQLGSSVAAVAVGAGVVAILAHGCTVSPPSAPSTNFFINIPVANDRTTIREVVEGRSSFLEIDDETEGMALHVVVPESEDEVLGTAKVEDNLKTPQTEQDLPPTPIGVIELEGAALPGVNLSMQEIIGQDVSAGESIPEFIDTGVDISPEPTSFVLENVTQITVVEGVIELDITNRLPMPISLLRVTLIDNADGLPVGEPLLIEDIGALEGVDGTPGRKSGRLILDGQTLSGSLAIAVEVSTPDVGEVEVGEDPGIEILSSIPALRVSSATGRIPEQTFSPDEPQIVQFPESSVLVDTASISQGVIEITIKNQIPLIVNVDLTVLDLVRKSDGQPVVFEIPLEAFDPDSDVDPEPEIFDLKEVSFIPADPEQLRVDYEARTADSSEEVTISSDQTLNVNVVVNPLVFSRVVGRLDEVSIDIPRQQRTVDIPAGLDSVEIATTRLEVHVTRSLGFLADVELDISGQNKDGDDAPLLPIRETFERVEPGSSVSDTVRVSPTALKDFLNFLPSTIAIESRVVIGDGFETDVVDSSHSVTIDRVVFDTEPRLAIIGDTQMDPEESLQDITFRDSEARRRINNNFVSAGVTATLENSIPLGVGVRLFVGRTKEAVFDTSHPKHVITIPRSKARFEGEDPEDYPKEPFSAIAAPVDTETRFSTGTETTEIPITLTKDEVLEFILEDADTDSLFSGVRVILPKTQGDVEIRASDFINIIAGLGVELLLNSKLVD